MNDSIQHLSKVAAKHQKLIIGLMSGTSLDGLDIVLCRIKGSGTSTKIQMEQFTTVVYPRDVSQKLKSLISVNSVSLEEVCLANTWLGDYHADLIIGKLREWGVAPLDVDVIASHGQTLYHAPVIQHQREGIGNTTLQIGDGDHIAKKTGILTVSDFRQKHTAAGGEGAPMVAFIDELLFRDASTDRILLNIGGIGNLTYLPSTDSQKDVISGDTGPGNTLINAAVQKHFDLPFDESGKISKRGSVYAHLYDSLMKHPYLKKSFPKTTGPEVFKLDWVEEILKKEKLNIGSEDLIASLTWFSAQTMADAIKSIGDFSKAEIYISGGGIKNDQLMVWLSELLEGQELHSFRELGFNPDAKEAVSFAVLANELLSGDGFLMNPKQNTGRKVNFGKISLPV